MSDDSDIPSDSLAGDPATDSAETVRLAIVSRSSETENALWSAIDERARSRNLPARIHADPSDADAIVYLPDEQDFATDDAAQSYEARLMRDPASSKVIFEPGMFVDSAARTRLENLRDRIGAHSGAIVWLAAKPSGAHGGGGRPPRDDSAQLQARRIERVLRSKARPSSARPSRQRTERTRAPARDLDVRRKARAQRIEQRKSAADEKKSGTERSPETGEARQKRRALRKPAASRERPARRKRPDAVAPAERPARPGKADDPKGTPLPIIFIAIGGMDEASKARLMESLKSAFLQSGARAIEASPQSKAHISVQSFGEDPFDVGDIASRAESLLEDKARLRMLLGRMSGGPETAGADDRAIARISLLCRAAFIDLETQRRRHRAESPAEPVAEATDLDLAADLIVREAINRKIRNLPLVSKSPASPPDLADAYALAARPSDLLSVLSWSASYPPKVLHPVFSAAQVEDFANSWLAAPEADAQDSAARIDWHAPSDARAASRLLGLGFLLAPLSYWYWKAGGRGGGEIAKIEGVLKERGVTASTLLDRAGRIILDFSKQVPPEPGSLAWREDAVSGRIRVLVLYVLCCRLAAKRRIKFDETDCGAVFRSLVDHVEFLRSGLPYQPASTEGVERDCLLAGVGLALQQTSYGNVLLRASLERLKRLQLDVGLSGDGVWLNAPFAAHCAVLSSLTTLLGDLAAAKSDLMDPLAEAARRMTLFMDALLKSNGEALPIDATRSRSFASMLAGARRLLAVLGARPVKGKPARGMAANRITETYVFRDAQYFVSHSTPKVTSESSQVAFHADPGSPVRSNPGGLKLAFAHGPTDLLLGAVPPRKELSGGKPATFDPALRNGYRVASGGANDGNSGGPGRRASLVKSWRGPGWAAAKGNEAGHGSASIARIVVHLKSHHALLVVDEFTGATGEAMAFEQFWHIAPGLAPASAPEAPPYFSAGEDVHLAVAFDNQHESAASIDRDKFGSCIRRTISVGTGTVATLFQRMSAAAPLSVSFLRDKPDDWMVAISGAGFAVRVSLGSNEMRLEDEQPPQSAAI